MASNPETQLNPLYHQSTLSPNPELICGTYEHSYHIASKQDCNWNSDIQDWKNCSQKLCRNRYLKQFTQERINEEGAQHLIAETHPNQEELICRQHNITSAQTRSSSRTKHSSPTRTTTTTNPTRGRPTQPKDPNPSGSGNPPVNPSGP